MKLAIYGKSGHGKVIADIAHANGFKEIIWIDDDSSKEDTLTLLHFKESYLDIPIALGIGDNKTRQKIYTKIIQNSLKVATLIHPSAIISPSAKIQEGSVVMANVIVNADSYIGIGVILNSACVIEHDNIISNFAHISPNVALAGNVNIGEYTHIGIGSSVIQGITIAKESIIGAGSSVICDIADNVVAVGSPAVVKKELNKV